MADTDLIGPLCIITAYGIICMESDPALLKKDDASPKLRNPLQSQERKGHAENVAAALPQDMGDSEQRHHIGRIAVYLAEAAQLITEQGNKLQFNDHWTLVKRPKR